MIQTLIVDDEPLAQEIMQTYLSRIQDIQVIGKCYNAIEAFEVITKHHVDLLILDVNMPRMSGISLLKALSDPPMVIFTTAHADYALTSYELNAVDYLLKPVSFERFVIAVNKAKAYIAHHKSMNDEKFQSKVENRVFIKVDNKLIHLDLAEVWFAEALKDYIQIWTDRGKMLIHSTMKNLEESLSSYPNFARVHKSYIVNVDRVEEVKGSSLLIKGEYLPIGNLYREQIKSVLEWRRLL